MSVQAPIDHKDPEARLHGDDSKHAHITTSSEYARVGPGHIDELDRKKERALVWKFDLHILPILAVMYLFNSLDKSNLGRSPASPNELSMD